MRWALPTILLRIGLDKFKHAASCCYNTAINQLMRMRELL